MRLCCTLRYLVFIVAVVQIFGTIAVAAEYQNVTPKEAAELLEKLPDIQLVDVRTQDEYDYAHLENSVLVPMRQIFSGDHSLSKEKPVLLYCAVGGRSYFAANILAEKGFTEVYNMTGGIKRWYQEELPLIIKE